jgi:predicted flap endonuclease-1-like 5' DNA nuclease
MKTSAPKQQNATQAARLGLSHGYCFDGDLTHLNASIDILIGAQAAQKSWALQLWASQDDEQSTPAGGIKIAEVNFGQVFSEEQTYAELQGSSLALPPAGKNAYTLFIVLASGADGVCETVEDFASYPQQETFIQPILQGTITCTLNESSVHITIDEIINPRPSDNLSGTLSLELWSLDKIYTGGQWSGAPVASLILGTLSGECSWSDCAYTASAAIPAQQGYLTLMLREWTATGYVTRDYRNLMEIQAPVATVDKKTTAKKGKSSKTEKTEKSEKAATPAKATPGTSVNQASEAELSKIKGLSAAVARAIIASRPYASLDELCRAKGMGSKLLAKVREFLTL